MHSSAWMCYNMLTQKHLLVLMTFNMCSDFYFFYYLFMASTVVKPHIQGSHVKTRCFNVHISKEQSHSMSITTCRHYRRLPNTEYDTNWLVQQLKQLTLIHCLFHTLLPCPNDTLKLSMRKQCRLFPLALFKYQIQIPLIRKHGCRETVSPLYIIIYHYICNLFLNYSHFNCYCINFLCHMLLKMTDYHPCVKWCYRYVVFMLMVYFIHLQMYGTGCLGFLMALLFKLNGQHENH